MSKPLLSFRPKPEIAEMIQTLAAEDRRPVGQFLANLVEDAIAQRQSASERHASQQHAA
jgi:hypothetical protein